MVKKFLKKLYNGISFLIYSIKSKLLLVKYKNKKPISNTLLIVAHPDDEVLFFHTIIKKEKPFLVLMSSGSKSGSSLIRMREFKKAMKYYGLQYLFFTFGTNDTNDKLLNFSINEVLKLKQFDKIYTHNFEGEYGHEFHARVNKCVEALVDKKLNVPFSKNDYNKIGVLPNEVIKEKEWIFNNIYKSQSFVLEVYKDWVIKERFGEDNK